MRRFFVHRPPLVRSVRFGLALGLAAPLIMPAAAPRAAPPAEAEVVQAAADPVFVGAGDIAYCGLDSDEATAALLDGIEGTVFTAGDNAYLLGTAAEFADCYGPTWGRHKARTRPTPGNHDYYTTGAVPYYAYFGSHAGPSGRGYYSYDLGAWHIVSLNSDVNVPAQAGSAQEQWLRADLAANRTQCTLAIWHHPVFNSGQYGNNPRMRDIWQALYESGADVVINGHEHSYEQFHRVNADGVLDANGIREFVVGTGGITLRQFMSVQPPISAVRNDDTHGVLKLTLHPTSYDWEFVPIAGGTFTDVGSRPCVGSAPAPVGGRGFAIGGSPGGEEMVWTTGSAQTAYAVARFAGGTTTILPGPGSFLPSTATDYTDTTAAADQFTCYILLPLGGAGVLGRSDLLCAIPDSGSSAGAPANARMQLDQSSMATLTWSPPGGQTAYVLWSIPLDGTPPGAVPLPAVATRAMHDTAGKPTCYVLLVMTGGSVTGSSEVLCALPGQSALVTAGSPVATSTVGDALDALNDTLDLATIRP